MNNEQTEEEFVLGRNVTELARGKAKDTIVMSVRLAIADFANLNAVAEAEGKTIAQVAREGIRARIRETPKTPVSRISFSIGTLDGGAVSFGGPWQSTRNGSSVGETQVSYTAVPPM